MEPLYTTTESMEPLETTTQSVCDMLMKFLVEQMEELNKRKMEEKRKEETDEQCHRVLAYAGLAILLIGVLSLLAFLFNYLWLGWKAERAGPVTRTPKIPIKESKLKLTTSPEDDELKEVKIKYAPNGDFSYNAINKVDDIIKTIFDLEDTSKWVIRYNTRLISIKMDRFKHGEACHDFEPIDGEAEGSYYTYQMYGDDKIQVTRYVVGDKSFVAGFCIYTKNDGAWGIRYSKKVVENLMKSAKYPGKDAVGNGVEKKIEELKMTGNSDEVLVLDRVLGFFKSNEKKEKSKDDNPPTYSSLSMI